MKKIAIILFLSALSQATYAATVWDWSFGGEAGQFVTDTGAGGGAGNYSLTDFSVTSSAAGGALGSISNGEYSDGEHNTVFPYSFDYDGNNVTQWNHSGSNNFSWFTFDALSSNISYFFGWDTRNVNDPNKAAWYDNDASIGMPANVSVTLAAPSAVPVPAALFLFGPALLGFFGFRRKMQS